MRDWLSIVAIVVICLTWLYSRSLSVSAEAYTDYISAPPTTDISPDGIAPELADVRAPLPLADMLTPDSGLNSSGYAGTAALDQSRILELGGQYVQRTNNYRHAYPDNGTAPLFEFNGSVYKSRTDISAVPPCPGIC